MKIKIILIFFTILSWGCSNSLPEDGSIKVGQQFSVVLTTDWKSRTQWNLINYDKEIVMFLNSDRQSALDPNRVGENQIDKPAQNIFYFKALKPGETDLEFKLEKLWGTGDYGRKVKHIIINP